MQYAATAGAGDLTEAGAVQRCARRRTAGWRAIRVIEKELRRIGGAKGLHADLQSEALRHPDRLGQRGIQIEKVRPAEIIPANIAEGTRSGRSEARGVVGMRQALYLDRFED